MLMTSHVRAQSMSFEVTKAFVNHYRANVLHLVQQSETKFRSMVRVHTDVVGKADHFDRIGSTSARKKTTRHADTPLISTPHSRRRVVMDTYEWADLIDQDDKVRLLMNPQSEYVKAGAAAMGRAMDDVIITAFNATTQAVDENDASSTVALPASQIIVHGGTGLTVAKLRQAKRILDQSDVPDTGRAIAISPIGLEDLLGTTEVTSSDFNSVKALVMGDVDTFLGFKFLRTTRLPKSGNIRSAFAWHADGMGLSIGDDVNSRVSERPDKSYATQVYFSMVIGAARVEEERVVEIQYDEAA
jgi:hypothetical protein